MLQPGLLILTSPSPRSTCRSRRRSSTLQDLQRELGLSYLFIAHNLSVVRHISDRVAAMYLGRIIRRAPGTDSYGLADHPYTQSSLSAAPVPDPVIQRSRRRIVLQGKIPNPASPPSGSRSTRAASARRRAAPRKFQPSSRIPERRRMSFAPCGAVLNPVRKYSVPRPDFVRWRPRHEQLNTLASVARRLMARKAALLSVCFSQRSRALQSSPIFCRSTPFRRTWSAL